MRKISALLLLALAFGLALAAKAGEPATRVDFPDLELYDLQGNPLKLSDLKGAVVVLNFWATWCGPCRMELPELQKLYNELGGKGLMVLAISVDHYRAAVPSFIQRMRLSLPVYFIDPVTERSLGIGTIPFTLVLDKEGKAVRAYPGYSQEGMRDLKELATELLAEKRSQGGKK
ncbi:MAG: TlpA family protein disulfide reductase [Thermoanaerobaculum sp.]|nr:TlpA family protein disulfide reductase [Thermoanaerobaculum sp.]